MVADSAFSRLRGDGSQLVAQKGGAAFLAGFEYGEVTGVRVTGTRVAGNGGGVAIDDVDYVWVRDSGF